MVCLACWRFVVRRVVVVVVVGAIAAVLCSLRGGVPVSVGLLISSATIFFVTPGSEPRHRNSNKTNERNKQKRRNRPKDGQTDRRACRGEVVRAFKTTSRTCACRIADMESYWFSLLVLLLFRLACCRYDIPEYLCTNKIYGRGQHLQEAETMTKRIFIKQRALSATLTKLLQHHSIQQSSK